MLEISKLTKRVLKILGDTEDSHFWDCQVDEHAFIASDVATLLDKAKTEKDLKKILRKIDKNDFQCEADWHSEIMSDISELLTEWLEKTELKRKPIPIDVSIKHFVERYDGRPKFHRSGPTVRGLPRKCCRFCIQIASNIILHAECCDGKEHWHRNRSNDRGPTKLSQSDFIENRDGHGRQYSVSSVIAAKSLVRHLNLKTTI